MEFGVVSIDVAQGAILAHSFGLPSGRVAKGRVLSAADVSSFRDAGVTTITVARLGADDVGEDVAADRLATALSIQGIRMEKAIGGRINLISQHYGVLAFELHQLGALNNVHEALTFASLQPYTSVEPGQMVGTVKVIPFSVENEILCQAENCAKDLEFQVVASQPCDVGLVQTLLPGTAEKVLAKTSDVMRHRIEQQGSRLVVDKQCAHEVSALALSIQEQLDLGMGLVLVVGASAVTDRRDVVPTAIERCGGTVDHFGIPVDPGNLLLLGYVGDVPILGVPGCARSPKLNGFDWVLQRLLCGLTVSSKEFAAMGAGGLLKEIAGRPMPRAAIPAGSQHQAYRIYVLVLAAGDHPEILMHSGGATNIAQVVNCAIKSAGKGVYVVTGAKEKEVTLALHDYAVSYAYNPSFDAGLSTSLRRGLSALPADADGVLVCRAHEPAPTVEVINALISAFDPKDGPTLCMPVRQHQHSLPMLIGRRFFAELHELEGDIGARYLVAAYPYDVVEVRIEEDTASLEMDAGGVKQ